MQKTLSNQRVRESLRRIIAVAVLVIATQQVVLAQNTRTITGTITDNNGEVLTGVNVIIQGTNTGVFTDINGNYSINIKNDNSILVVSYIGYEEQKISIGNSTTINITLKEEAKGLDEIVVIGYGSTTKKEITGSVSSLKTEDFNIGGFTDPTGLIQGKVAGLNIINPNGADPQSNFEIMLRGTNTLNAGSKPLIIVDGVEGADLKNVNFQEVESIDVLKDGSAAAIYGTRGSNGVIIITTKRAKAGTTSLEFSSIVSAQVAPRMVKNLTADEFRHAIQTYAPTKSGNIYSGNTNWFDEVTRDVPISQNYNIALSGGSEKFSHRSAIGIERNQGLLKDNNLNKIIIKTNVIQKMLDERLIIDYNLTYGNRKYNPANYSIFAQAFMHNPTEPVYDPSNTQSGGYTHVNAVEYYNPVAMLKERTQDGRTVDIVANVKATLNLTEGLSWSNFFGYESSDWEDNSYKTRYYPSALGSNGIAEISNGYYGRTQFQSIVNYKKYVGEHNIQGMAGYSYLDEMTNSSYMANSNFDLDRYLTNNISAGAALKEGRADMSSSREASKLISFFGRAMYNYSEKYLLSASLRYEGSSRFGKDHRWGLFPAVSAGWRINKESFLRDVRWIDDLKLRAGYGVTGNQEFPNYKALTLVQSNGKFFYNGEWINTYEPASNPNPDLRWEKKHEFNVGVDFSTINSRLGGSVDFYVRRSTDLVNEFQVPSPPNLYSTMYANVGTIENIGIEITLNGVPIKKKDFVWSTTVTSSHNSNKLIKYSNESLAGSKYWVGWLSGEIATNCQAIEEGKSLGTFYGPVWLGVDQFGNDKFKNQKPDGRVNEKDWEVIGNAYPDIVLGWSNNFQYKNWNLSFSLRASIGGEVLNSYRLYYENFVNLGVRNIVASQLDNPNFTGNAMYSSKYIEDASFLKLDNISLGYTFNLGYKYIKTLRLYAAAQNVFCITKYTGVDPEVSLSGLYPGIENRSYYPRTISVSFGLNFSF